MFVTSDKNRATAWTPPIGDERAGSGVWLAMEQLIPRDILILRVSRARSRAIPTIVMLDLTETAPSLEQFIKGNIVVRGAAVFSTRQAREVDQWTLDPLREIRVGATEYSERDKQLVAVTRFTTTAGHTFSVQYDFATRPARGTRLWRAKAPDAHTN